MTFGLSLCDIFSSVFVTFSCGILSQVVYLIVSISNLCLLTNYSSVNRRDFLADLYIRQVRLV